MVCFTFRQRQESDLARSASEHHVHATEWSPKTRLRTGFVAQGYAMAIGSVEKSELKADLRRAERCCSWPAWAIGCTSSRLTLPCATLCLVQPSVPVSSLHPSALPLSSHVSCLHPPTPYSLRPTRHPFAHHFTLAGSLYIRTHTTTSLRFTPDPLIATTLSRDQSTNSRAQDSLGTPSQ